MEEKYIFIVQGTERIEHKPESKRAVNYSAFTSKKLAEARLDKKIQELLDTGARHHGTRVQKGEQITEFRIQKLPLFSTTGANA